jgi:RAB protein geranylgeranyltransferase component A
MEIVTEINEKFTRNSVSPKETLPETIHSTKRFGYQKSQNVWSIEFLPKFLIFLKNLVKILIKMLG